MVVVNVQENVMFPKWERPVTVVTLDNGQWATDEKNQEVKIGDKVSLHARGGKTLGLVPYFVVEK